MKIWLIHNLKTGLNAKMNEQMSIFGTNNAMCEDLPGTTSNDGKKLLIKFLLLMR